MFIYGKMAANAIAVMSYLASHPEKQSGSGEIAQARRISKALTAKILTKLAAAGYVLGRPGPGGGYRLARPPEKINLADIVRQFEQANLPSLCPFGSNWCGIKDPCPLHDAIAALVEKNREFIETTDLSVFAPADPGKGRRRPR